MSWYCSYGGIHSAEKEEETPPKGLGKCLDKEYSVHDGICSVNET